MTERKYFDIHLHVIDEASLYNPLDPTGLTFNSDVYDYIEDCYSEKHLYEVPRLLVSADTPIDQERLKKAFIRYLQEEQDCNERERKRNTVHMLRLLIIGLLFIVAGVMLANVLNAVGAEILSIIGSFAVWEAAGGWFEQRPQTADQTSPTQTT